MGSVLISDTGRELPPAARLVGLLLSYPAADFDIIAYAVRNCGWLHLRWERQTLRIRLRPQNFSRAAYRTAVEHMVAAPRGTRFVFEQEGETLPIGVLSNVNDAVAHLEDMMSFAGEGSARATFFSEELSLGRLKHPKRRVLRELIKSWKRDRGVLPNRELAAPFRAVGAGERFVVTKTTRRRCTVAEFGMGITVFGPEWSEAVIGRELEDQPDRSYGERSAQTYHEVYRTNAPRFELIDALIRPSDGRPVQRCRYERLVLPWLTESGEMFVSGTSYLRTRFHFPA
jgi:hypothetical protein